MTSTTRLAPQGTVNLTDFRNSVSQNRANFTRLRGTPKLSADKGPAADFITLIALISEIYRTYGEKLAVVQQFHPNRETQYNRGHTSSVSHTKISRHGMSMVTRGGTGIFSEGIIVKRPRESVLEETSYALISFITELRIRTHAPLREHPNIAQFRGVGWDFEDEEATIPRPLMLEELAPQGALDNFWEKWNFVRLNFKSKLDLSRNVAEGVLALHDSGVVHGDIKPENILVFPRRDADNAFMAKLTDFGHSVFEHSRLNALPAFTPKWCAPELMPEVTTSKKMDFKEMKATDYYSYGLVVLSIMIGRPFHGCIDNIDESKLDDSMLKKGIELVNAEDRKKHDSDLDLSVIAALLRRTIRRKPAHRDLKHCIKMMDRYDRVNGLAGSQSHVKMPKRLQPIAPLNITEMVAVGHTTLWRTSHQLKAHIATALQQIANNKKDPRQLAAAWEIAVCYYSGFGVDVSFQTCSDWLTIAAKGGIVAAQNYFEVLHKAMKLPHEDISVYRARPFRKHMAISEDGPNELVPGIQEPKAEDDDTTLEESEYEFESDSEYSIGHTPRPSAIISMPKKLSDIFARGTHEGLQAYLENEPEFLNSQDGDGNTPLILAARGQHVHMLQFLVSQAGVDASITNNSEQTVLHFLPALDVGLIKDFVPKLVGKHADINHEALPVPLGTEDTIFTTGIRCCSILNAILHQNMVLLECLLEASHTEEAGHACRICEAGSRFRRILAVSLSIFRADALGKLLNHLKAHDKMKDIDFRSIRVWANEQLLPIHMVPFKSVAIGALDLPESFFRAISFGAGCSEALENTIKFLLTTLEDDEQLSYSILTAAVENNSVDAVRFMLQEAKATGFPAHWWVKGPLDTCPLMLSISFGFRGAFKLLMEDEPAIFQSALHLKCWVGDECRHRPSWWKRLWGVLIGRPVKYLPVEMRTHRFNQVQRAIWLLVDAKHQDSFFLNAILDASDSQLVAKKERMMCIQVQAIEEFDSLGFVPLIQPEPEGSASFAERNGHVGVEITGKLDGSDFFEQAVLLSLFSVASTISDRCPEIWKTALSRRDGLCFWRSRIENNVRATSRPSIYRVLAHGSYEQCRFVMERLLPLRTAGERSPANFWGKEKSPSQEDGILEWTRCPLSSSEFDCLLMGNIKMPRPDRQLLWNVIEAQVKIGQSSSVSYLNMAVLHGNTDALEEMLHRGWDVNGPWWHRFRTPLQYSLGLKSLNGDFKRLFTYLNPDLPQTDWIDNTTHAVVYHAYLEQLEGHSWTSWIERLKTSQEILRSHGGKTSPLYGLLQIKNNDIEDTVRIWVFIAVVLLYGAVLPLSLTYATTRTWTTMTTGQKLGFSYLWSFLCACVPPWITFFIGGLTIDEFGIDNEIQAALWLGTMWLANHLVLPLLIVWYNWQPFWTCKDVLSASGNVCEVRKDCTNYSFLVPLAAAGIEIAAWWMLQFLDEL